MIPQMALELISLVSDPTRLGVNKFKRLIVINSAIRQSVSRVCKEAGG